MSKKKLTIGIDIGGTKMSAVLFDGEKIINMFSLATPKDDLNHMLVMVKALIEPLLDSARQLKKHVGGVGVGVAGEIDNKEKRVVISPNISYLEGLKIGEKISEFIGLPVIIDNDANCFLRAEMKMGNVKKFSSVYGITIGTGIGGAWWYNNDIYQTENGGSGEPGQMVVDFNNGLLLEEAYHKIMQNNPANMAEEAFRGDVLANRAYEEFGQLFGIALSNIVNIIAPEVIVIGGSVIESGDLFLKIAKKTLREHISSDNLRKKIKVLKSKVGKDAGAIGAALLVHE